LYFKNKKLLTFAFMCGCWAVTSTTSFHLLSLRLIAIQSS